MSTITFNIAATGGPEAIGFLKRAAAMCNRIAAMLAPPSPACECGASLHPGIPHEEALATEERGS